MAEKLTDTQWKLRAQKIWGSLYDYSQTEYVRSRDKVSVYCRKCQDNFFVIATQHINSTEKRRAIGCQRCSKNAQTKAATKAFETMLEQARRVHGWKYQYDESTYKSALVKMAITCPTHGIFWQAPDTHINRGHGCKKCSTEIIVSASRKRRFDILNAKIKKASENLVEASFDSFQNHHMLCDFNCRKHGQFKRKPSEAIGSRHPCPSCLREIDNLGSKLEEADIRKAFSPYKELAEIQSIKGNGKFAKIIFRCLKNIDHGLQETSVERLYGKKFPCPKCAYENSSAGRAQSVRSTYAERRIEFYKDWKKRAIAYHGEKYDYSRARYVNARTKVEIVCPVKGHGSFFQTPDMHLRQGCRLCANDGLKGKYSERYFRKHPHEKDISGILYYVKIVWGDMRFYKVGLSKNDVKTRFSAATPKGFQIQIIEQKTMRLYDAFKAEQKILLYVSPRLRAELTKSERLQLRSARIASSEIFGRPLSKKMVTEFFA